MPQPNRNLVLGGLAFLAILAYLPVFSQPFIADDFVNILKAAQYAPVSGWKALAADPVHFHRPVFLFPTWWVYRTFGAWPPAFYALSVLLHILVTWLVFALGAWRPVGWRVAAVAAAFFAVYEGHQEAVMWYSASYELYQALFLLASLICWVRWLESPRPRWAWYPAALVCFALALASKESAVILLPLLLLPPLFDHALRRRALAGLAPFVLLGLGHVWWIFWAGGPNPRFGDGSFSLRAPAALTWFNSYGRLLWIWGVAGLGVLAALRDRGWKSLVALAGIWMGVALLPYCFLTYMPRVPSRHTYLASVGLAWLVAAGVLSLAARRRTAAMIVCALVLTTNVAYLWVWKRAQYLERAEATEALIALAQRTQGPIYVQRFPYLLIVAQEAVVLMARRPGGSVVQAPSAEPSHGLRDYSYSLNGEHPIVTGRF